MATKVYKKGDAFPAFPPNGTVRLYNMRFCPYAQRARLVLAAKGIKHELIYIHIRDTLPEWYRNRNPNGQVPALEYRDGRTLYESAVVAQYLDDEYPGEKLTPSDPFTRAKHGILLSEFSKVTSQYYAISRAKAKNEDASPIWRKLEEALKMYERELEGKYFGGDKAALIDFLLWPHFERFPVFKSLVGVELSGEEFPQLTAWIDTMRAHPAVQATVQTDEHHLTFIESVIAGNPKYGLGLE